MKSTINRKYGWKPDLPDQRDFRLEFSRRDFRRLPPTVDLTPLCPPVYQQGQIGSCTSNSICFAHQFDQMKQKAPYVGMPSRLFHYYNERAMEGTTSTDSGASIRDGMKTINSQGVCPASDWPYITKMYTVKPPAACYKVALKYTSIKYQAVAQTQADIQAALAAGFPVVFGFTVYESFESQEVAQTGIVPMPQSNEAVLGGHAVAIVGFLNQTTFQVRNSWGQNWGQKGYFTMPVEYVTNPNLASDFWVMQSVKD